MVKFETVDRILTAPSAGSSLRRGVRLLLVAGVLVPLVGCATKRDVRDLQTEIRELNSRQEALLRELQRDQRATRDSVQILARDFGQHRSQLGVRFQNLEDLIFRVQELAGLSQQELAGLRDQMALQRQQTVPFDSGAPAAGGGGMADDIYQAAVTQMGRGSFTAARMGFQDLIERYPNHTLTPHARYHLADIAQQQGELEQAIEGFESVARFHPASERVPDAYYRVGMIHVDRGELGRAREYFERVVNTWPQSGVADLARDALRQIP